MRSSAVAEDRQDASFAGQQETELWVLGADAVEQSIVRCWASLFTPQAIGYRARVGVAPEDVVIAVVVQRMVPAVAAGVAMTLEPVTGDRSVVYLESALGLGEGVVKGDVETDRFWIDKATGQLARAEISSQSRAHRFDPQVGGVRVVDVAPGEGDGPSIGEPVARRIGELAMRVEAAAGRPMDIEWALAGDGEVHLVQGRPETVWSNRPAPTLITESHWRATSVTNYGSPQNATWSTTNAAEAVPGVQSPLGASFFEVHAERAFRETFGVIGALSPDDARFTPIAATASSVSTTAVARCGSTCSATGWTESRAVTGKLPPKTSSVASLTVTYGEGKSATTHECCAACGSRSSSTRRSSKVSARRRGGTGQILCSSCLISTLTPPGNFCSTRFPALVNASSTTRLW